jgi:hypothetical protein
MSDIFPEYKQHPVDKFILDTFAVACYQPYVPLAVDGGWYGKTFPGQVVLGRGVDKEAVLEAVRTAIKNGVIDVSDPQFYWDDLL